jgi:hypothetical protein
MKQLTGDCGGLHSFSFQFYILFNKNVSYFHDYFFYVRLYIENIKATQIQVLQLHVHDVIPIMATRFFASQIKLFFPLTLFAPTFTQTH